MAIYELGNDAIRPLTPTTFSAAKIRERDGLQRLLREQVDIISPQTLVIAEEFGEWEDANRRIDLLGVDKQGNLVVIELKRTETGGHMELQAIRYAAMVSTMTFERAVDIFQRYLAAKGDKTDAEARLREHLEMDDGDEAGEDDFAQDVRIVLASAEFGKELTTAVMWLNERGLDIRCVRLRPYSDGDRVLIDVQQVIPLPEAEQYQVQIREKAQKERASRRSERDYTKYDVTANGQTHGRLNKGQAVYALVSHLCANGVTPQQIMDAVTFRKGNSFWSVDGDVRTEAEFVAQATKDAEAVGRKFDAWRFSTGDGELIHADGKTYAVSKQWGPRVEKWMRQVIAAFPGHNVTVRVSDT